MFKICGELEKSLIINFIFGQICELEKTGLDSMTNLFAKFALFNQNNSYN